MEGVRPGPWGGIPCNYLLEISATFDTDAI